MTKKQDESQNSERSLHEAYKFLKHELLIRFDIEELKDVCLDIELDYQNAPHNTKPELINSLLRFADVNEKKKDLLLLLSSSRDDVTWPEDFKYPSGRLDDEVGQPIIEFGFNTESGPASDQTIIVQPINPKPDFKSLVGKQRDEVFGMYNSTSDPLYSISDFIGFSTTDPALWKQQMKDYLDDYESYLDSLHRYNNKLARVRKLEFSIGNIGKAPVEQVLVQIRIPKELNIPISVRREDFDLYLQVHNYADKPKPPKPPRYPDPFYRSRLQRMVEDMAYRGTTNSDFPQESKDNVSGPKLTQSSTGTIAEYEIKRLLPNFGKELLKGLEFWTIPEAEGRILDIEYKIGSGSLPETIDGSFTLHVVNSGVNQ